MAYTTETSFTYSTEQYREPFTAQWSGLELQMNIKYDSKNECQATYNRIEQNAHEMIAD